MDEPKPDTPNRGLPVSGYKPQSDAAVTLVNANKAVEEQILRVLDKLGQIEGVDKRWLAIGRTSIEQGFMAVNRAIFKPGRVEMPDVPTVESGWLIESAESSPAAPLYLTAVGVNSVDFRPDHEKALRFARKDDAVAFVNFTFGTLENLRIAEHQWG